MLLVIDNYDSFTYNLVALLQVLGEEVVVARNDTITPAQALALQPSGLVISPGPGRPLAAGNTPAITQAFWSSIPILGICLGHQLIAELSGASVVLAGYPMHGKTSTLSHTGSGLFAGVPAASPVMRYHSLVVAPDSLPSELEPTAWSIETGELMALQHRHLPIFGLQFHPESVLSSEGHRMLAAWVDYTR